MQRFSTYKSLVMNCISFLIRAVTTFERITRDKILILIGISNETLQIHKADVDIFYTVYRLQIFIEEFHGVVSETNPTNLFNPNNIPKVTSL